MRLTQNEFPSEQVWDCSSHAVTQFIDRNKFCNSIRDAIKTLLNLMKKALFLCYEKRNRMAEIYASGGWILVVKESTIVTVYEAKGSKYEHLIVV